VRSSNLQRWSLRASVDLADRYGDRLHEIQTDHMGAVNLIFFFSTHVVGKLLSAATNER
jgi:hypothetical protein